MTILPFAYTMNNLYYKIVHTMGFETPEYSTRYNSNYDQAFCEYIYKQSGIYDFAEMIAKSNQEMLSKSNAIVSTLEESTGLEWECTVVQNSIRILHKDYYLNKEQKEALKNIYDPYIKTKQVFEYFNRFDKKDSPKILGNNWKLKKIFSNCKATKNSTLDPYFVLSPEIVDEVINHYFLYTKCGWNPNE